MSTTLERPQTRLTFDDYDALPSMAGPYSILDGEMIMAPSPDYDHQWCQENIVVALRFYVTEHGLGVVIDAPADLVIRKSPLRVREPDVMFFSKARSGWSGRHDLKGVKRAHVAPELVVEVLSESDRHELAGKLDDYRLVGVTEAWLVDTDAETVTVLRLSDDETLGVFNGQDAIRSAVLPEFVMTVQQVFA